MADTVQRLNALENLVRALHKGVTGLAIAAAAPTFTGSASDLQGTVANSQLEAMPAHTFKGNNTGGSASPQDLTAAQATAELDDFVGDSGSGGTKGLVPAPAAGDTAAGKFLGADGLWHTTAATVDVDAAGALDGDGSPGSPLAVRPDGVTVVINGSNELEAVGISAGIVRAWGFTIDGGGAAIAAGVKGFSPPIPFGGTITKVTLISSDGAGPATAGDIKLDIWRDDFASYPPSVAETITASAKPELSSANSYEDAGLSGWDTTVTAGDVFGWYVEASPTPTVTRVTVTLEITT